GENRLGTDVVHRSRRREERERSSENFIATSDIQRAQRQQDGVGPVCHPDRVCGLRELGALLSPPSGWWGWRRWPASRPSRSTGSPRMKACSSMTLAIALRTESRIV